MNPPGEKDRWRTAEAGGFTVYSNTSEGEIVRLEANLQHMRDAFGSTTHLSVRSPRLIKVFLFDDTKAFAPYRDFLTGRNSTFVAGAFVHGRDAEYIILDGQRREASEGVAYHELTHFFIANNTLDVPLSVQQGARRLLFDVRSGRRQGEAGRPDTANLQLLRGRHLMPLERLLSVTLDAEGVHRGGACGGLLRPVRGLRALPAPGGPAAEGSTHRLPRGGEAGELPGTGRSLRLRVRLQDPGERTRQLPAARRHAVQNRRPQRTPARRHRPDRSRFPATSSLFELGDLLSQCNACDLTDARAFLTEALRLNPSNEQATLVLGLLSRGPTPGSTIEPHAPRPGGRAGTPPRPHDRDRPGTTWRRARESSPT